MHRLRNDACIFIPGLYEACSERVMLVFSLPSFLWSGKEKGGEDGRKLASGSLWCFIAWEHRLPLEMLMRANADGQEPKSEPPQGAGEQSEGINDTQN